MYRLKGTPEERHFMTDVIHRSGQNLLECLQCGRCTASCPISSPTVGGPRRLIAQILCGMREDALRDPTWWYCVSCGTCASRCPVEINMYHVATTLCEMAAEAGIDPIEPSIHLFEDLFLRSVRRYGRVRELKTVMRYNLQMRQPFKDAGKGLRLILKGAISPLGMMRGGRKDEVIERIFARRAAAEPGETDHEG